LCNEKAFGSMRRYVRRFLRTLGYDVTAIPMPKGFLLREYTLRVFSGLGINLVFDVGAHWGEYGSFLRRSGYGGAIVSFEPVASNFVALHQKSAKDPRWKAYKFALGSEDAIRPIQVTNRTDFSSFLSPNSFSAERFGELGQVAGTEMVEVRRLDSVFEECTSELKEPRVFLKMDTQGYDLKVLEGTASHIDQILALQSEISVENIYTGMIGYLEAIARMTRLGFDIVSMVPVTTHNDGLRAIEFDCIMVRRP